jgi:hypothetical protein
MNPPAALKSCPRRRFLAGLLLSALPLAAARPADEAEAAASALALDQETAGFAFRAETWVAPLPTEFGKALRLQLFKGNEYCIAVAVPRGSGIHVTGAVLDFNGEPVGEIQPVLDGWGFLLFFKPKKTGVYVVTIRQDESGARRDTTCAVAVGYK